jgi:hypothetical protein
VRGRGRDRTDHPADLVLVDVLTAPRLCGKT